MAGLLSAFPFRSAWMRARSRRVRTHVVTSQFGSLHALPSRSAATSSSTSPASRVASARAVAAVAAHLPASSLARVSSACSLGISSPRRCSTSARVATTSTPARSSTISARAASRSLPSFTLSLCSLLASALASSRSCSTRLTRSSDFAVKMASARSRAARENAAIVGVRFGGREAGNAAMSPAKYISHASCSRSDSISAVGA